MNWQKWISISIGLNATLVGVAAYLHFSRADRGDLPAPAPPPSRVHSTRESRSLEPAAETKPSEPVPKPFDWSQLESEDLRIYCGHLRAVGCPEKTIAEILLPIIEENYARRLRNWNAAPPGPFWLSGSQRTAADRQRDRQRLDIQREKAALIEELFGRSIDAEALREWHRELAMGFFLGFLSEGKPEQVLCLAKKDFDQASDIRRSAQFILTPEDMVALNQLYDQCRHKVASLLTPNEMEELELRMTVIGTIQILQESVMGLEVTGTEIRNLMANLAREGNSPLRLLFTSNSPTQEEKDQLRQSIEKQMRSLLGDTRFTHYQRMQDRTYKELFVFGEAHDLPRPTVGRVYEVYLAVKDEETKIRKNQQLSAKQRDESLAQARQSSEEALRGLLGDRVFEDLKKGRRP